MGIETIERDAFHGLSNLAYPHLMGKKLLKLPGNLFRPLRKLRKSDVGHKQVTSSSRPTRFAHNVRIENG